MAKKVKYQSIPSPKGSSSGYIPKSATELTVNRDSLRPLFCFMHFQVKHKDHTIKKRRHEEYVDYFEHLARMSSQTWFQIKLANKAFHYHELHPANSRFKGFENSSLNEFTAYQFKVSETGRAVGYFDAKNIFHIVFISPDHDLYN